MFVSPTKAVALREPGTQGVRNTTPPPESGDSEPVAPRQSAVEPARQQSVSNVEFDAETKRVVIQQVHASSGTVVRQYPSEAQLKIREYVAGIEGTKGNSISDSA